MLDDLFEEGYVSVGRWAKKSADPETIALVTSVVIALLTPVWDGAFKEKIAPRISSFFSEHFQKLRGRQIYTDFIQHISYNGHEVQVLFIPVRGQEANCFGVAKTVAAMLMVHDYLVSLELNHTQVAKIFVRFNGKSDKYEMIRVEYADGTLAEGV